jgi:hypothetical protein
MNRKIRTKTCWVCLGLVSPGGFLAFLFFSLVLLCLRGRYSAIHSHIILVISCPGSTVMDSLQMHGVGQRVCCLWVSQRVPHGYVGNAQGTAGSRRPVYGVALGCTALPSWCWLSTGRMLWVQPSFGVCPLVQVGAGLRRLAVVSYVVPLWHLWAVSRLRPRDGCLGRHGDAFFLRMSTTWGRLPVCPCQP